MEQARYKRVLGKNIHEDAETSGLYYIFDRKSAVSVNEIGARIFELCDGSHTMSDICEKVLTKYDVGIDELKADINEFIEMMLENNIVKIVKE